MVIDDGALPSFAVEHSGGGYQVRGQQQRPSVCQSCALIAFCTSGCGRGLVRFQKPAPTVRVPATRGFIFGQASAAIVALSIKLFPE